MSRFSQHDLVLLLADRSKRIIGDIMWTDDPGHPPAQRFRADISSDEGWPIWVRGWWQPPSGKLSYTIVHLEAGRIFSWDLGSVPHTNPDGAQMEGAHMHRWTEDHSDHLAIARPDIGLTWEYPLEVWQVFCAEANIAHLGLLSPPILKGEGR